MGVNNTILQNQVMFATFKKLILFVSMIALTSSFSINLEQTQGFLQRQAACIAGVASAQAVSVPGPAGGILAGICYDYTELIGDKEQYDRLDRIIKSGIPTVDLSGLSNSDIVKFVEQARLDADPVSSVQKEVSGVFRDQSEVVLKGLVNGVFASLNVPGMDEERVEQVIEVLKLL